MMLLEQQITKLYRISELTIQVKPVSQKYNYQKYVSEKTFKNFFLYRNSNKMQTVEYFFSTLGLIRRIYTSGFRMHFPHCVAIFYNLPWLSKTKVSYKKSQCNVVNACGNRMCKLRALFTRDILAHNIAIKRYCDKKLLLSHGFQRQAKVST